jgi:hypothetical protein
MNQPICPESLDISLIDFEDFSYSISPDREIIRDESVEKSITRHGILHPPIVKKKHTKSYVIVAGRKRISAYRSIFFPENKSCYCMIIPAQTPEINVFSILLEENLTNRQLTPIEKAIFLCKISPLTDEKYIAKAFLPRLDLPPNPYYIKQSTMLLDLEEPIIRAIHQGLINEKVTREIASLSAEDRLAVFHVISSLHPSASNQKKLIDICRELASRENSSIAAILEDKEARKILNHQEANPPQKTKNLMNCLYRKYMPRSSHAADEFKLFAASMHLPENVSLTHTPFFEDDSITLSINFSNRKSAQNAWKKIKDTV